MLIATNLRTEHLAEPLGIDIPAPRLFWNCEGCAAQTAYRITARRDGTTIWDTGKPCFAAMTGIRWDGPHYSPGSVCQWIFETVCGVDVTGDRAFTIAPQPGGSLTEAILSYDSVFGIVCSAWKIDRGRVRYTIVVPANTTAEVRLPGGTRKQVNAGTWTFEESRVAGSGARTT